jgi:hypothetical protein
MVDPLFFSRHQMNEINQPDETMIVVYRLKQPALGRSLIFCFQQKQAFFSRNCDAAHTPGAILFDGSAGLISTFELQHKQRLRKIYPNR